ncbi:MAG TPA: phage tail protein [Allosphingosinicella sp.]|nr:phage tail protein [Allosphingosinicella sp.]
MTPPPFPLPWFGPQGFGDIPVGAMMAFAGRLGPAVPPSSPPGAPFDPGASPPMTYPLESWGWTVCDGRSLDRNDYPELFAALGNLYGGSDPQFKLPDYRGYFLRGLDPGGGADPDRDKRTAAVPGSGGNAEGVGSTQGCAFQQHEHQYLGASVAGAAAQGEQSSATTSKENYTTGGGAYPSDVKTSPTETRPVNVYVNYIIKFTAGLRRTNL